MPNLGVTIEGDEEVQAALLRLGSEFEEIVRKETRSTAYDVEGGAKERAAVNFGRLRTAIRTRFAERGLVADVGIFERTTRGSNLVNYGPYVEDGTRAAAGRPPGKMPPIEPLRLWAERKLGDPDAAFAVARKIQKEGTEAQPFLRPSFEEHARDYPERVRKKLRDALT